MPIKNVNLRFAHLLGVARVHLAKRFRLNTIHTGWPETNTCLWNRSYFSNPVLLNGG